MNPGPLAYPCRFKKLEDGRFFVRFPDLPEAMAEGVDEADAYRSAVGCLTSVLLWRLANEIEIPPPSRLRPGHHLIALRKAQILSDAIAQGRSTASGASAMPGLGAAAFTLDEERVATYAANLEPSTAPSSTEMAIDMPRDRRGAGAPTAMTNRADPG